MGLIKVTNSSVVNVCTCGSENEIPYSDVIIFNSCINLPLCPRCEDCFTAVAAQPYSDSWSDLNDDAIKRYILGQQAHYFACQNGDSKTIPPETSKTDLMARMTVEQRYEFVGVGDVEQVAPVHPMEKKHWEKFKETGKVTPKAAQKLGSEIKFSKFKDSIKSFAGGSELDRSESNTGEIIGSPPDMTRFDRKGNPIKDKE